MILRYTVRRRTFFSGFLRPGGPGPARTTVEHPEGDMAFMLGIPAIGTKFKEAGELGPQSRDYHYLSRRVKDGALQIELTFDFSPKN